MQLQIQNLPIFTKQSLEYCSHFYCMECSRNHCILFSRNHCISISCLQFESEIVKKGLSDQIPSLSDKVGLNRAYKINQPFVILNLTKVNKPGDGWFAGLTLYDPKSAEIIFQNEIWLNLMWDGWTDQGTMFPLFNSLLDYLRKQEKNE